MRTQEQIIEQCAARLRALEVEAAEKRDREVPNPERPFCSTCKFLAGSISCTEPLVKGLSHHAPRNWDAHQYRSNAIGSPAALCGEEKALWQPKPAPGFWATDAGHMLTGALVVIGLILSFIGPSLLAGFFFGWDWALGALILTAMFFKGW